MKEKNEMQSFWKMTNTLVVLFIIGFIMLILCIACIQWFEWMLYIGIVGAIIEVFVGIMYEFFVRCPKCDAFLGETIFRRGHYCQCCGISLEYKKK